MWRRILVVNSVSLSRAALAVLIIALLIGGAVLGGAVTAFGEARLTPSPSASPSPSATARPALPTTDAPGEDIDRLPRYPGSVRTEYEIITDDRYRLTVTEYFADATIDEVRAFYQGVIHDHGWTRADIGYAGGEWTYVLVDGSTEALIEIEMSRGYVEIDLQISERIATPSESPEPSPEPSRRPTPVPTAAPPPPPPAPAGGDDDDDSDDDDSWSDWTDSDD